jgi:hypothetical protein
VGVKVSVQVRECCEMHLNAHNGHSSDVLREETCNRSVIDTM